MNWSDSDPEEDLERSVSSMSSNVSKGKHLTGESLRDIGLCSEDQPKGLDATRSSTQVITFEDELIDYNHKESCKKTTLPDELNSANRPDDMLSRLRAAIVPDEPNELDEECNCVSSSYFVRCSNKTF